jgi:hypothetical protein
MAKMGRPTKYKKEYCKMIIDYFKGGQVGDDFKYFPSIAGFCCQIHSFKSRVYEWADANPDFRDSLKEALGYAEQMLSTNALNRKWDSGYARFLSCNYHDLHEKTQTEVNVTGGLDLKGGINITWTDGK